MGSLIALFALLELGSPKVEVVSDELHDGGGVLVDFLLELLNIGNSHVEGLLGELTGLGGVVHDFVVEDGEVKGQSESDGVGGLEVGVGNLDGGLVGLEGTVGGLLVVVTGGVLSNVSVVVTLHLEVEDGGVGVVGGAGDQSLVEDLEDVVAELVKLGLDLALVVSQKREILGSLGLLLGLDGGKGSPGGSSGSDGVFVGDGKKVSLLDAELLLKESDLFHVFEHVLESLGLLTDFSHEDKFLSR